MESINCDWKIFQTLFYFKPRPVPSPVPGVIYLLTDKKEVISVFCEDEDLSEWIGAPVIDVLAEFTHRETVVYDRKKVDQNLAQAVKLPHYYDQMQYLNRETLPDSHGHGRLQQDRAGVFQHFLLEAIQSRWQKFFPVSYGIYIGLDGIHGQSILLIVRKGRLSSFYAPDLSLMTPERRRQSAEVVKYLAARHLVPVQGLFLTEEEWAQYSQSPHPWPQILKAVRTDRTKLMPFRWGLVSLMAGRAWLGI